VAGAVDAATVVTAAVVATAGVGAAAGITRAPVIVALVVRDGIVGAVAGQGRWGRRAGKRHHRDRGTGGETSCGVSDHAGSSGWCPHCGRHLVPSSMGLWSWALAGAAMPS
jgi:hypothetical protein